MPVNYQKLYAYLAGQIDDTLQILTADMFHGKHGYDEQYAIWSKLRAALTTAEEMYLDDTEKE